MSDRIEFEEFDSIGTKLVAQAPGGAFYLTIWEPTEDANDPWSETETFLLADQARALADWIYARLALQETNQ